MITWGFTTEAAPSECTAVVTLTGYNHQVIGTKSIKGTASEYPISCSLLELIGIADQEDKCRDLFGGAQYYRLLFYDDIGNVIAESPRISGTSADVPEQAAEVGRRAACLR